jgi:hypothetical protein
VAPFSFSMDGACAMGSRDFCSPFNSSSDGRVFAKEWQMVGHHYRHNSGPFCGNIGLVKCQKSEAGSDWDVTH